MAFAFLAVLVYPRRREQSRPPFAGDVVLHQDFTLDFHYANAADPRVRTGEIGINQFAPQSDRLEDLRAAIAPERGGSHL